MKKYWIAEIGLVDWAEGRNMEEAIVDITSFLEDGGDLAVAYINIKEAHLKMTEIEKKIPVVQEVAF